MSKKGYGGFLGPIANAIGNAIAREGLVILKRKNPHRGGIRITSVKNLVDGKDKYGRKTKKKGR